MVVPIAATSQAGGRNRRTAASGAGDERRRDGLAKQPDQAEEQVASGR